MWFEGSSRRLLVIHGLLATEKIVKATLLLSAQYPLQSQAIAAVSEKFKVAVTRQANACHIMGFSAANVNVAGATDELEKLLGEKMLTESISGEVNKMLVSRPELLDDLRRRHQGLGEVKPPRAAKAAADVVDAAGPRESGDRDRRAERGRA